MAEPERSVAGPKPRAAEPQSSSSRARDADPETAKLVTVGLIIALLAGGWFVLSRWVMHNSITDAIGEALGVGLALMVVVSVIGAVLSRERADPPSRSDQGS
jgi:hypothetical protein